MWIQDSQAAIHFMMTFPLQLTQDEYDLVIILEDENIERLKKYDPAEIVGKNLGSFAKLKIRNIQICYATPEETMEISNCHTIGEVAKAIRKLGRGFRYRPELGDSDSAYQTPRKN